MGFFLHEETGGANPSRYLGNLNALYNVLSHCSYQLLDAYNDYLESTSFEILFQTKMSFQDSKICSVILSFFLSFFIFFFYNICSVILLVLCGCFGKREITTLDELNWNFWMPTMIILNQHLLKYFFKPK
jgi:hypothetical protein